MNIVSIPISDLHPYEKNPRKNDEAVKYVAESIKQFGFRVPIIIDRSNVIVAGHTRYKAAKKLKLEKVPCIVADDLSEEQIKAFRLADNKVAEKAEWDFDLLGEELSGILDIDMSLLGFEDEQEVQCGVIEDEFDPEPPEEPISKRGDIYLLGKHRLKKTISAEITRGIASSLPYADIARNISNVSKAPLSRANTIVRTEGHRIQQASTSDAQHAAKAKGADVLKQWDAALDGKTRPNHRKLDGQIREIDEPFEVNGRKVDRPGEFGDPAEDCNCRCACTTRARWALDESELDTLKERAAYFGIDKSKDFDDFKKKYLKAVDNLEKSGTFKMNLQLFAEKDILKQESASLKKGIAKCEKRIAEHKQKLANPQDFVPNWDAKDEREKNGLKKHWKKEIKNFQQSIDDRADELRKRGDS